MEPVTTVATIAKTGDGLVGLYNKYDITTATIIVCGILLCILCTMLAMAWLSRKGHIEFQKEITKHLENMEKQADIIANQLKSVAKEVEKMESEYKSYRYETKEQILDIKTTTAEVLQLAKENDRRVRALETRTETLEKLRLVE